jgi:hypothetical protein
LIGRDQNVRIVLGEVGLPQLHGTLEHGPSPTQIPGVRKRLRTLPGGKKRGRLGHVGNAAPYAWPAPGRVAPGVTMPRDVRPRPSMRGRREGVYSTLLCGPPGCRYPVR